MGLLTYVDGEAAELLLNYEPPKNIRVESKHFMEGDDSIDNNALSCAIREAVNESFDATEFSVSQVSMYRDDIEIEIQHDRIRGYYCMYVNPGEGIDSFVTALMCEVGLLLGIILEYDSESETYNIVDYIYNNYNN